MDGVPGVYLNSSQQGTELLVVMLQDIGMTKDHLDIITRNVPWIFADPLS